ncbi:Uncharacterised protein [Mycobacterium tuberculosis]|nr:Uncharacterised protein [Mycobacterium tuberculosis]
MERPGKCLLRCDTVVAQPGESAHHHVDLDLRARGQCRNRFTEQAGQHRRCDPDQNEPAPDQMLGTVATVAVVAHRTVWIKGENVCTGDYFGAVAGSCRGQGRGHRPHAADWDVPDSGAPTDQVIQEADVLHQRRFVHAGEGADQRVGGDHPA